MLLYDNYHKSHICRLNLPHRFLGFILTLSGICNIINKIIFTKGAR